MKNLRRLLTIFVLPALILAGFAVSTVAADGPDGKVTVCQESSHFHAITISRNALAAHLGKGDVMPDEYGDCDGDHENGDQNGDNQQEGDKGEQGSSGHDNGDKGNSDD